MSKDSITTIGSQPNMANKLGNDLIVGTSWPLQTAEAQRFESGVGHHSFSPNEKPVMSAEEAADKLMSIADQWWDQISQLPYELRYEIISKLVRLSQDNVNNVPRVSSR